MKKYIFAPLLLLVIFACNNVQKSSSNQFANLDHYLQNEVKEGRLKGVHAVVFQGDTIQYNHFFGMRDVEAKDTMQGNEEYYIQSMTKPIVTVGLMQLVEKGKVKLDDPIEKYLPEFKNVNVINDPSIGSASGSHPAKTTITIQQILSHTSGLSHGISPVAYDKEILAATFFNPKIKTLAERVKVLASMPLMFEPNTRFTYSFSVDLTGRIIEVVSGKSLDEYLKENILNPLGMKNTGYNLTDDQVKRVMVVYDFMKDSTLSRAQLQPASQHNTLFSGVNALFSSITDYMTFARMLLNKGTLNGTQILKSETIDLMTKTVTDSLTTKPKASDKNIPVATGLVVDGMGAMNLEPGYDFGLGLCVLKDANLAKRNPAAEGEFFWAGANSTYFFVNPSKKMVAVFMTQIGFLPNTNPYHYYFGDKFRENIYKDITSKQ